MKLIIFIGIQATGKSEFYKRNLYKTHIRINLDMLKTRKREDILLEACIRAKQSFVIDNTNPTAKDRSKYIKPAKEAGFKIIGYYFKSSVADAISRNSKRSGPERVPTPAILDTHKKLEPPLLREGFDELWYVRIDENGDFVVEEYKGEGGHNGQ